MATSVFSRSGVTVSSFSSKIAKLSTATRLHPSPNHATAKRTQLENPMHHTNEHIGLFYTIPESDKKQLFGLGGFPKSFEANLTTFGESCLMVRKPALEVIDFLKRTDYSKPVVRYVLYGKKGCGKSVSLAHIIHYAYLNKFYVLHVPWVWNWFRSNRTEVTTSNSKTDIVDLPIVAAQWLKHFQSQNSHLLADKDIAIKNEYVWNIREKTPAGSPLSELVLHGINRVKYASDCIGAIIKELKMASNENKCKIMIAIDGFNALFGELTNFKTEDKKNVTPSMVSLTNYFLEATKNDWCNGAIVLTVDQMAARHNTLHSHLPLYLLGKKGFEHIDPFICVNVPEFSDVEINSMLDYYEDRRWLQRTDGRSELSFISNRNPYQLMTLCASL